ncbi:MAG: hypothetical protein NXH75_00530 [Halobacteriovoraceae bacterium]|nr:hypothetical protein [Halobacteriovoraceae bacterium]
MENILQNFPNIALASTENNEEILDFFSRFSLKSKAEQVHYHREPDFFSLLRARGEFLVFTLREDSGDLQGVAVVTFRKGFIEGKETEVGYLGDLRVTLNRKLIRQWRSCFKEFIECSSQLEETRGCRYFQTALMEDNNQSKVNLASNKIPGVFYNLISPYKMVNVVGRWKKRKSWRGYTLRPFSELDSAGKTAALNLLASKEKELPFGHCWPFEKRHRQEFWTDFNDENILVLVSAKGSLLGVTSFYNPSPLKKMSLSEIPSPLKLTSLASKLLPFYQQAPLPKEREELSVIYLESGIIEDGVPKEILPHLAIQYLFNNETFHMIAITEWKDYSLEKALKGTLYHKTPMGLYSVHPLDQNHQPLYTQEVSLENYPKGAYPRFDMAMV